MKHTQNENAVSPVIGVILMVMITVVLAGVIAAFVFGMPGNISKAKVVAVTVQQPESGKIVVTYMGGQDAHSFDYGTISVVPDSGAVTYYHTAQKYSNGTTIASVAPPGTTTANLFGSEVGSSIAAIGIFTGKNQVTVVGHFTDGSAQVLIDTYI